MKGLFRCNNFNVIGWMFLPRGSIIIAIFHKKVPKFTCLVVYRKVDLVLSVLSYGSKPTLLRRRLVQWVSGAYASPRYPSSSFETYYVRSQKIT